MRVHAVRHLIFQKYCPLLPRMPFCPGLDILGWHIPCSVETSRPTSPQHWHSAHCYCSWWSSSPSPPFGIRNCNPTVCDWCTLMADDSRWLPWVELDLNPFFYLLNGFGYDYSLFWNLYLGIGHNLLRKVISHLIHQNLSKKAVIYNVANSKNDYCTCFGAPGMFFF